MYREKGNHIVTTIDRAQAALDTCKRLERQGFEVTYVPVGRDGLVDVEAVRAALTDKTILVSIMFANNEIGTIQPIAEIGKLAKEKGILFHTDATQAVGKIPVDVEAMGIDLLSATAHKMYGPKGVGALYVRRKNPRVRLAPMIDGGGHERGMRSGTVTGAAGSSASGRRRRSAARSMAEESKRLAALRDRLQEQIVSKVDEAYVNGHPDAAPAAQPEHQLRVRRRRVGADGAQQGGGVASGSACTSATLEPSYVI